MGGPSGIDVDVLHGAVLALAAIAACTDVRWGTIPNWLTLPLILGAPLAHGLIGGMGDLTESLLGLLVCSIVPLLIWYRGGMAAGDVKLFAAIGAVAGVNMGLRAEFLSLVVAAVYAVGQLTWSGKLLRSLGNSLFIGLNPILPRRYRREVPHELMHQIRLGAAILLGSVIALSGDHQELWA